MKWKSAGTSMIAFWFSASSVFAAPLDSLAKNLAGGASSLKDRRIAVLTFPYHDGKTSSGSTIVSERLTTLLVGRKKIHVVERSLIEQLMTEKKLSETGVVSQENLKIIGSLLGTDAVVTGTLIDLSGNRTEINARMIEVASGEVISVGQEVIERSWKDSPIMPRQPAPPKKATKVVAPEEEPEIADVPLAYDENKPALKLSNESFPPDRRRYLAQEKYVPQIAAPESEDDHPFDRDPRHDKISAAPPPKEPENPGFLKGRLAPPPPNFDPRRPVQRAYIKR